MRTCASLECNGKWLTAEKNIYSTMLVVAFDFPLFYRVRSSPLSLSHARALLSKQYSIDLHV